MSKHQNKEVNEKEFHILRGEERTMKIQDEVKNIDRNDIYNESANEFILYQFNQENDTSIDQTMTETETSKNNSEDTTSGFKHLNDGIESIVPQLINKETICNQLVVLEPNNPVMVRFQCTLKLYLLKQKDNITQELLKLDGVIKSKLNDKLSFINEINNVACQVETQHNLLSQFHQMKMELQTAKKQVETCINQGKKRNTEIKMKTTVATKEFSMFRRQLDCSHGLLKELLKYEKEQEITFNMCNQKKSQAKHYKKKLLNEQQKQDLLLLSLTQEILRLEDRMKQLGEQAETKYNERELLKQKVMDSSTDLDTINEDNTKITLLWNDVLINIQQRDKSFQKLKNDFQETKNKYHTLLMEANSYKNSSQEEFLKNYNLINLLNKLNQENSNLQSSLQSYLDKFIYLKEEYSKLIQITEFQHQNLAQIILDQKSISNEIHTLLRLLDKKSNQKLKYEDLLINELKKQLFANNNCVHINNKINELKVQNKEHELVLVSAENNLSQILLKIEQYRTTSFNLENMVEEHTKHLNEQGHGLLVLNYELKKLNADVQNKSKQIEVENKQLETVKERYDERYTMTPQMQIVQVSNKIDEVEKEIDFIKQSWVQKQNTNVQLLDQCNKQFDELNKMYKYALVMNTKNSKLEQEIVSLFKEIEQSKRTLTNMRSAILKLNENFSQNKGKSCQLLNENEWIQCSYLVELKDYEKLCLEYVDELKLLKNELNEIKNVYIEKQRESKSWDAKVQMLVEMKKEMKKKVGDLGDIYAMKNEIHRMQIRKSQLKKILEKIMLDLEVCVSRREMIYNKVAAKDIRLKKKNVTKQKFLKKFGDLRANTKKIKTECNKLDRNISDLQLGKMELENKLTCLNDRLNKVQKNVNYLMRTIEDIGNTKIKNIHNLSTKQSHAKFLDEVKKGKYRLLVKSESKMNEDYTSEWKKNSDLISVVEALKNDFPYLDVQIIRLLNILKSIEN